MSQSDHQLVSTNLLENLQFEEGNPTKERVATIAGVNFVKLAIKAGDELAKHHVNKAAFAVLLQGKASFPINDVNYALKAGDFLEIPKDAEHSVMAEEDSLFLVGIIGTPASAEAC